MLWRLNLISGQLREQFAAAAHDGALHGDGSLVDVSCEVRWLSPHGTPRSSMGYERKSNWKSNWIPSGNVVNISITLENLIFFS